MNAAGEAVKRRTLALLLLATVCCATSSCRSTYYATMEQFGKHKRDLLVDRVEDGRAEQEAAKEQFRSALGRFSDVVAMPNTDLKAKYEALSDELEESEERAAAVTERVQAIERVAEDLFREWESELGQYSSADLRRASERQLKETQNRAAGLIAAMKRGEQSMQPVLSAFRDHVLFLKHNLNAQAIASLRGELSSLETDTAALIRTMERAIAEADAFIRAMKAPPQTG